MGAIIGIWGVFWIGFGLYMLEYMLLVIIEKMRSGTNKGLILFTTLLIALGGLAFNLFWFNPTAFNSVMNYLNLSMRLTWQQLLPLGFVLSILRVSVAKEYKITKLWDERNGK